jgi:hypothetical protein
MQLDGCFGECMKAMIDFWFVGFEPLFPFFCDLAAFPNAERSAGAGLLSWLLEVEVEDGWCGFDALVATLLGAEVEARAGDCETAR